MPHNTLVYRGGLIILFFRGRVVLCRKYFTVLAGFGGVTHYPGLKPGAMGILCSWVFLESVLSCFKTRKDGWF